ncbi:MAG: hypothetical protein ACKPJD_02135, partial [Planctomycetaceae bacterium]
MSQTARKATLHDSSRCLEWTLPGDTPLWTAFTECPLANIRVHQRCKKQHLIQPAQQTFKSPCAFIRENPCSSVAKKPPLH